MTRTVLILSVLVLATIEVLLLVGGVAVLPRLVRDSAQHEPSSASESASNPPPQNQNAKQPDKETSEEAVFVDVPISKLKAITANHRQGTLGFTLDGTNFFYYISAQTESERSLATSGLLADFQRASHVSIRHESHGFHRLVTNLLLFYDTPVSPESLPQQSDSPATAPK